MTQVTHKQIGNKYNDYGYYVVDVANDYVIIGKKYHNGNFKSGTYLLINKDGSTKISSSIIKG
jgi:hypothetical protein